MMSNRNQRSRIGRDTLDILNRGGYLNSRGVDVSIASFLNEAKNGTVLIRSQEIDALLGVTPVADFQTTIQVSNETTLSVARRWVDEGRSKILCLNFASAMYPGGGFLEGSQAQEESLARASGLYECLLQASDYYAANRKFKSNLYRDHFIYSPDVPDFRDDDDQLLDEPYLVSFLTVPAVDRGAVETNEPRKLHLVDSIMRRRVRAGFAIAQKYRYQHLVLGAWGCGVFRNNPNDIATMFADQLVGERARYGKSFAHVQFAVLDLGQDGAPLHAFNERLQH